MKSRQSDGARRSKAGRFAPGNRAGKGRTGPNVRTLVGRELVEELLRGGDGLPPVTARLRRLLMSRRELVRLRAEELLLRLAYGSRPNGLLDAMPSPQPPGPGPRLVLIEAGLAEEIGLRVNVAAEPPDDGEDESEA